MTVLKCDICGSETFLGKFTVSVFGKDYNGNNVDAEAKLDICEPCKGKLVQPVEKFDTRVKVIVEVPSP